MAFAVRQVAAVVDWLKAGMEGSHLRGPTSVLRRSADLLAADVDAQLRPVRDFLLFAGFTPRQVRGCSTVRFPFLMRTLPFSAPQIVAACSERSGAAGRDLGHANACRLPARCTRCLRSSSGM